MKTYKEFEKEYIGDSDIASLTLRGPDKSYVMNFGQDDSYYAYIVTEKIEIPSHYELVFSCTHWLWIFDDRERTAEYEAKIINVYRAGEMGCLIEAVKEETK